MKEFNTSGPNLPDRHYTLVREAYLQQGMSFVQKERYFTIWAPRQTGKSTYFRQLAERLQADGYEVAQVNFENYHSQTESSFLNRLSHSLKKYWDIDFSGLAISDVFQAIESLKDKRRFVLIIDEVEGINPAYFGTFLHTIRNAYHSRHEHPLKSVILVGVSNIVGVVSDNASPFNISENLSIGYFTQQECNELLAMHEQETMQLFDHKVKEKIYDITAGQPGLVNGFANQLVTRHPNDPILTPDQYLAVEHWYINIAIDKNVANIINKAKQFRPIVERLLFTEAKIPFDIDRESIKILHTNGILREDEQHYAAFWVPLYQKRLYKAFYPYTNGESDRIVAEIVGSQYLTETGKLNFDTLISHFKSYIKRRGFGVFRERTGETDEYGNPTYHSIPEAAMIYAFETYIQAVLIALEGKSYREAQVGSGRSDLIINIKNDECLIETKIFYSENAFQKGKQQIAYYCQHLGLDKGIYLVFMPEHLLAVHQEKVFESVETKQNISVYTYIVPYEQEEPNYRGKRKKRK